MSDEAGTAPPIRLVSTELECPVVALADGSPAPPEVFAAAWRVLARDSWQATGFGVWRERRRMQRINVISSGQVMATDTGPVLELAPSPSRSLAGTAAQLTSLRREAARVLDDLGYAMLGAGVHPTVRAQPQDYYRYRTPRPTYDYVIQERGWHHWSILNVASVQEIVDVDFDDAPRAVRVLHRLAGLMNFLLRNDPDLHEEHGGRLSVRPQAWRRHVPQGSRFPSDAGKVVLPPNEVEGWQDYLELLWSASPMFLVGTKDHGAAWVPEHPTFSRFLFDAPEGGWPACALSGEQLRIRPMREHLQQTDWTYLGFARIRWKWRTDGFDLIDLAEAWKTGRSEEFLRCHLEKVVVENRSTAAQPPGETLVSLHLVAGLLANLGEASAFVSAEPRAFWVRLLEASATQPIDAEIDGRSVPELATRMIAIARRGLERRGEPEAGAALVPLEQRIACGVSPAERLLEAYRSGGVEAVLRGFRLESDEASILPSDPARLTAGRGR